MSNVRDPITIIVEESIVVRFFASSFHVVDVFVPSVVKRKKEGGRERCQDHDGCNERMFEKRKEKKKEKKKKRKIARM